MSVVSVPELQNYMSGIKMSPSQVTDAEAILDGLQSELEIHLGRPLQQRRVMEETTTQEDGRAYLDVTPIMAVYGIYYRNEDGTRGALFSSLRSNWFERGSNFLTLGVRGTALYVDYLGGLNGDLIPGVKSAIKRVARRDYLAMHGDTLVVTNSEVREPNDPTPVAPGWQEEELDKFDRLRRRTVR